MGEIIELFIQLLWAVGEIKEIIDNSERAENFYQKTSSEFDESQINKKWETLGCTKISKLKKSKRKSHSKNKS